MASNAYFRFDDDKMKYTYSHNHWNIMYHCIMFDDRCDIQYIPW